MQTLHFWGTVFTSRGWSPTQIHEDTPQGGGLTQHSQARSTEEMEENLNGYGSISVPQKLLL